MYILYACRYACKGIIFKTFFFLNTKWSKKYKTKKPEGYPDFPKGSHTT